MHQISLTKSEQGVLTAEQCAAWIARGYVILKSHLPVAEVAYLAGMDPGADDYIAAHESLVRSLAEPVRQLMDAEPVLLSLRRGATETFGLDVLDPASGPTVRAATAVVMLQDSSSAAWAYRFFAGSHLVAPEDASPDPGARMFRIAEEIRDRGLAGEVLAVAPGDVWIRHPRLMRGALRTGADSASPPWLTAIFGRYEDLPRGGLATRPDEGGPSARSVFAASRSEISSIGRKIAVE